MNNTPEQQHVHGQWLEVEGCAIESASIRNRLLFLEEALHMRRSDLQDTPVTAGLVAILSDLAGDADALCVRLRDAVRTQWPDWGKEEHYTTGYQK